MYSFTTAVFDTAVLYTVWMVRKISVGTCEIGTAVVAATVAVVEGSYVFRDQTV
jgi:hypothetical protein